MAKWLVVYDTETTGLKEEDEVIQFASIFQNMETGDRMEMQSLIKPEKASITPEAFNTHKISESSLVNSPRLTEVISRWVGYSDALNCDPSDIMFAGHNVQFDARMIHKAVMQVCGSDIRKAPNVCTLSLSRRLYPDTPDHKLGTMYESITGKAPIDSHNALGDCRMAIELVTHFAEKTGKSLDELSQWLSVPMFVEKMPFGKHKGVSISKLSGGYIKWLKANITDVDVLHSLRVVHG